MIEITKYSTPNCMNCKILSMRLKPIIEAHKDNCIFTEVDITTQGNPLNISSVPWVVIKREGEELYNDHVSNVVEMISKIKTLLGE